MFKHCSPHKEDGYTSPPPPHTHTSIPLQQGLFPNWRPGRCESSLGNRYKSDEAESGELGGSCCNSKPKYLQVSCLSFADTLLLLELLFCPFLEYTPDRYTRVNPFPNKPWFLRICSTSLLKTLWKKEKLLVTSNFSFFSHSVFFSFGELSTIFVELKVVFCTLFQFGRV